MNLMLIMPLIGAISPIVDDGAAWSRIVPDLLDVMEAATIVEHQGRGLLDVGPVYIEMGWLQSGTDGNTIEARIEPRYPAGETGAGYVQLRPVCEDPGSGALSANGNAVVFSWVTGTILDSPIFAANWKRVITITGQCGIGEVRAFALAGTFVDESHEWADSGILGDFEIGWGDPPDQIVTLVDGDSFRASWTSNVQYGGAPTGPSYLTITRVAGTGCAPSSSSISMTVQGIGSVGTSTSVAPYAAAWGGTGCPNTSKTFTFYPENLAAPGGWKWLTVDGPTADDARWYPPGYPGGLGDQSPLDDALSGGVVLASDWLDSFRYDLDDAIAVEDIDSMCQSIGECVSRCDIGWDWNVGQVIGQAIGCLLIPTIDLGAVVRSLPDLSEPIGDARIITTNVVNAGYDLLTPGVCGNLGVLPVDFTAIPGMENQEPIGISTCEIFPEDVKGLLDYLMVGIVSWASIGRILEALAFAMRWKTITGPLGRFFGVGESKGEHQDGLW